MLKLIVLIKPVPDLSNISISRSQSRIFEKGPRIINPADLNALEAALKVRDEVPAEVLAVSLGRPQEEVLLRKALAMGASSAYLVSDPDFEGGDALSDAYVLALAIKKLAPFDLVLCGDQSEKGIQGQTAPRLAEVLGLPHVLGVSGLSVSGQKVILERQGSATATLELKLPAVLAAKEGANSPRIPPALRIIKASKEKVSVWGVNEIGADAGLCGGRGAATRIIRSCLAEAPHG